MYLIIMLTFASNHRQKAFHLTFTCSNLPKIEDSCTLLVCRSGNTFTWLSVIERLHVEDSCTWLWDDFTNYFFQYRSYLYVTPNRIQCVNWGGWEGWGNWKFGTQPLILAKNIFNLICWNYLVPSFQWNSIRICSKPALHSA